METPPPSPDSLRATSPPADQCLIVVSNRLPVTIERRDNGSYSFKESSRGLAIGMSGVKREFEMVWYGWPGIEIPLEERPKISKSLREEHHAIPVLVDEDLAEAYYNGFSNSTLWPLLHYQSNAMRFRQDEWEAYHKVNQRFAETLATDIRDGDLIRIHDYHLMLLPQMLSEAALKLGKKVTIGFFLHTPFPRGDMFKVLPVWDKVLEGLLRCKTIGFHTQTYAQNFARTCCDYLKYKQIPTGIARFLDHMKRDSMKEQVRDIRRVYNVSTLIIGVDRLDHTTGPLQKITAIARFLESNPQFIGQVSLIQVAVPSRESVQDCKDLATNLHHQVEALNRRYGSDNYQPIHLLHQRVPFDQLMAMYAASDVCFVSSIRDGMNLVSCEYVATQRERKGVLLLSEFAGAAELLHGSILFNPCDIDGTVEALRRAVTMGANERSANQQKSEDFVVRNSSSAWGKSCVNDLNSFTLHQKGGEY